MECNGMNCDCSSSKDNHRHHEHEHGSKNSCDCPGCAGGDPMDFVMMMWHKAAMQAMIEIKKDKIKAKMEVVFGDTMDKSADAVVESMHKMMSATMEKSSIESQLRGKLASIMSEAMRK